MFESITTVFGNIKTLVTSANETISKISDFSKISSVISNGPVGTFCKSILSAGTSLVQALGEFELAVKDLSGLMSSGEQSAEKQMPAINLAGSWGALESAWDHGCKGYEAMGWAGFHGKEALTVAYNNIPVSLEDCTNAVGAVVAEAGTYLYDAVSKVPALSGGKVSI